MTRIRAGMAGCYLKKTIYVAIACACCLSVAAGKCTDDDDPSDNPDNQGPDGSIWTVSYNYNYPFYIMEKDGGEILDRPLMYRYKFTSRYALSKNNDNFKLVDAMVSYEYHMTALPVSGLDGEDYYIDCQGCQRDLYIDNMPSLFAGSYTDNKEWAAQGLDLTVNEGYFFQFYFTIWSNDVTNEQMEEHGCAVQCTDQYPGIFLDNRGKSAPGSGFLLMSPVDQVITYTHEDGGLVTIQLRCIENCQNIDCSGGCNDNNPCTSDKCETGYGCVYTNLDGGGCEVDACTTEGTCAGGQCQGGSPIDCNDQNECTIDVCTTEFGFGCSYFEDNRIISNDNAHDCVMIACAMGEYQEDFPINNEEPIQDSDSDCMHQICDSGEVLYVEDPNEPGCP